MHIFVTLLAIATLACSQVTTPRFHSLTSKSEKKGYPFPNKSIKNMTEEELEIMIDYAKSINDSELVYKAFFHILNASKDHTKLKSHHLNLADYCFSQEEYKNAGQKYEEFCKLYPGCNESEYAQYKLILCTFYTSLSADRDQADTIKITELIPLFLQHAKNELFISELNTILQTCRKRLFEHEVIVFETYLKQQRFTGAQKRLEYMQENFKDVTNIDLYVAHLEQIYIKIKNPNTRPFTFKIKLEDALKAKKAAPVESDFKKAVSFFVA